MTSRRLLVALAAAMLTIGAPGAARAQAPQQRKPSPRKVLRLQEMKVEGRIQKPQAMFLMPRADLSHTEQERVESFLPKVAKAAEREPL
jgi:hypothetical protein